MPRAYGYDFRLAIVQQYEHGETVTDIANEFGISRKTVYSYINSYPMLDTSYANCGNKQTSVSDEDKIDIIQASVEDPFRSASKMIKYLGLNYSVQCVNQVLRKAGLWTRHAAKKTKLTEPQRTRRIEWSSFI